MARSTSNEPTNSSATDEKTRENHVVNPVMLRYAKQQTSGKSITVLILKLDDTQLSGSKLQQESIQLERLLASQPELQVGRPPEPTMEPGQRGAVLELAKLIVTPVAAEAAKALVNVLSLYLQPKRHDTAITITGADGTTIQIKGASLTAEELESTIRRIKALLEQ